MTKKIVLIASILISIISSLAMKFNDEPEELSSNDPDKDRLYTVTRGDFSIKVLCQGTLTAIKKYDIPFNGRHIHNVEIQSIIDNQSPVKKGDVVATLNSEDVDKKIKLLREDLEDREIKYKENMDDIKINLDKSLDVIKNDRIFSTDIYLNRVELREKDFYKKKSELTRKIIDFKADFKQLIRRNEIALKTDSSNIERAHDELRKAYQSLKKFNNLDAKQKKNEHLTKIENSETKLNEVKKLYEDAKQQRIEGENKSPAEKKHLDNKVQNALKQIDISQKNLDFQRASMRNYMQYGHAETKRNLINNYEQKKLEYENKLFSIDAVQKERIRKVRDSKRNIKQNQLYFDVLLKERERKAKEGEREYKRELVELNNRINERQKEYKRNSERYTREYKDSSRRLKEELERNVYNKERMILKAPVDGIVSINTYHRDGGQNEYRAGSKIHPNQVIAYVPDLSQFRVDATVPEVYRSMIRTGLSADMYSPAIPDLKIPGKLEFIAASVSYKNRWDKNSPKIYETKLATPVTDKRLMPGTTINIEINVDQIKSKLFVPIEALYFKDQDTCCKISRKGKLLEKIVKAGRRSNSFVEILDGLNEGDKVFLQSGVAN